MWVVYYKFTFACDVVWAFTKEQAKKKAIQRLKNFWGVNPEIDKLNYTDYIEDIERENPILHWYDLYIKPILNR